jgi:hypothetical protein
MVKASNKAQQRQALPRSSTTIKKGKEQAAKQAKQKVNNNKGPHFRNPIAVAYADKIKQACLDDYNGTALINTK